LKLKFKQSVFIIAQNKMTQTGEIVDVKNKAQAKSFIEAGYAEAVIEETPSKKVVKEVEEKVEEKPKPKKKRAKKASDE
jgi:hypothetical protein